MVPAALAIAALYMVFLESSNPAFVYGRVTVSVTTCLVSVCAGAVDELPVDELPDAEVDPLVAASLMQVAPLLPE